MTKTIYLTVDDSPSEKMDDLLDFFATKNIPAIFFCRGDFLETNPAPVIRAIGEGHWIGNHAFNHTRFSTLSIDDARTQIEQTDQLIENAYTAANIKRPIKIFRFPYLDRGYGEHLADYTNWPDDLRHAAQTMMDEGITSKPMPPDPEKIAHKNNIQKMLVDLGYRQPIYENFHHDWITQTELGIAADMMVTYSTGDWKATARHRNHFDHSDLPSLCRMFDQSPAMQKPGSHLVLIHDQSEITNIARNLVDHMIKNNFSFSLPKF